MLEHGIISGAELQKIEFAGSFESWPERSLASRRSLHQRSLAMGAADPLKPTYAKFMKRKQPSDNAIQPLRHGMYFNRLFVR